MDPLIRTRLHNTCACVCVWCACVCICACVCACMCACVYMHLCLLHIFCMLKNNDMIRTVTWWYLELLVKITKFIQMWFCSHNIVMARVHNIMNSW